MIKSLKFDSDFFKYRIGKIDLGSGYGLMNLAKDLKTFQKSNFDCIYFEVPSKMTLINDYCKKKGFLLACRKIVLIKNTTNKQILQQNIVSSSPRKYISDFPDIAKSILSESRFNKDPRFKKKACKLYELWVKKSLYDNYCQKYFISVKHNKAIGLITLKIRNNNLFIDLFGILPDFRRQGLGKELLNMAESWAWSNRFKQLFVTTANENKIAFKTYISQGYKLYQESFIYHIWRNHEI